MEFVQVDVACENEKIFSYSQNGFTFMIEHCNCLTHRKVFVSWDFNIHYLGEVKREGVILMFLHLP